MTDIHCSLFVYSRPDHTAQIRDHFTRVAAAMGGGFASTKTIPDQITNIVNGRPEFAITVLSYALPSERLTEFTTQAKDFMAGEHGDGVRMGLVEARAFDTQPALSTIIQYHPHIAAAAQSLLGVTTPSYLFAAPLMMDADNHVVSGGGADTVRGQADSELTIKIGSLDSGDPSQAEQIRARLARPLRPVTLCYA